MLIISNITRYLLAVIDESRSRRRLEMQIKMHTHRHDIMIDGKRMHRILTAVTLSVDGATQYLYVAGVRVYKRVSVRVCAHLCMSALEH